jgi:hypothetical protein
MPSHGLSLLQGEALASLRGCAPASEPDTFVTAEMVQRNMEWPVETPKPSASAVGRALARVHAKHPELARWRARRA